MDGERLRCMKGEAVNKLGKLVIVILFLVYILVLSYFLFFSERYGRNVGSEQYKYNLIPFKEIKRFIEYRHIIGWERFTVNIFGNVFAFAPFGFLLPIVSRDNRDFFSALLYSFEFSLFIELIQLSFQVGAFDIDDIILNTLGGVFGFFMFCILKSKVKRFL